MPRRAVQVSCAVIVRACARCAAQRGRACRRWRMRVRSEYAVRAYAAAPAAAARHSAAAMPMHSRYA